MRKPAVERLGLSVSEGVQDDVRYTSPILPVNSVVVVRRAEQLYCRANNLLRIPVANSF